MIDTLYTILYFIIAILILVTVHEFGHYLAAIWTKTRAEIFSVGMGRRLFGWNKIDGFSVGDVDLKAKDYGNNTDWRLSLLPIGGYVKISGMVDESMEDDELKSVPKPYEFRSKTALQKIFILSAGVIFNIVLAFILFVAANVNTQDEVFETNTIGWVNPYSKAYDLGFRENDKIIAVNEVKPVNFQQIINLINRNDIGVDRQVIIQRDDEQKQVLIPYDSILKFIANKKPIEFVPQDVLVVFGSPLQGSNAQAAGFMDQDTVYSVNEVKVKNLSHFRVLLDTQKNKKTDIGVLRGNGVEQKSVKVNNEGKIGIGIGSIFTGSTVSIDVPFTEAISRGWDSTINMFQLFFQSIKQIFEGSIEAKQAIGGPIMIAQQAKIMGDLGLGPFFIFLASLSVSLAIINILPLPVLDGGHILIVLIEKIKGSEISEAIKMRIQAIGMVLMFLLMAVILFIDITR